MSALSPSQPVTLYTDGSFAPQTQGAPAQGAGSAVWDSPDLSGTQVTSATWRLPIVYSSLHSELIGVALAIFVTPPTLPLTIFLDNQGLVTKWPSLTQPFPNPRGALNFTDYDLWHFIYTTLERRSAPTQLKWVKGHQSGNSRPATRNRQADKAAREGLAGNPLPPPMSTTLPYRLAIGTALIPSNTSTVLRQLTHSTFSTLASTQHQGKILMDTRFTKKERKLFGPSALPRQASMRDSSLHAWKLKTILGLLPTATRLHRDDPSHYPSPTCPVPDCHQAETQAHLWMCQAATVNGEAIKASLQRAVRTTMPRNFQSLVASFPWLAAGPGPHWSTTLPQEDLTWLARGGCPRSLLDHPAVSKLPHQIQTKLITDCTEAIMEGMREHLWLPRCKVATTLRVPSPPSSSTSSQPSSPPSNQWHTSYEESASSSPSRSRSASPPPPRSPRSPPSSPPTPHRYQHRSHPRSHPHPRPRPPPRPRQPLPPRPCWDCLLRHSAALCSSLALARQGAAKATVALYLTSYSGPEGIT